MYQSIPRVPIPTPGILLGHLSTGANILQRPDGGAFDSVACPDRWGFDNFFSKKSNAQGVAWGADGHSWN